VNPSPLRPLAGGWGFCGDRRHLRKASAPPATTSPSRRSHCLVPRIMLLPEQLIYRSSAPTRLSDDPQHRPLVTDRSACIGRVCPRSLSANRATALCFAAPRRCRLWRSFKWPPETMFWHGRARSLPAKSHTEEMDAIWVGEIATAVEQINEVQRSAKRVEDFTCRSNRSLRR
jgi:hypothetical protein